MKTCTCTQCKEYLALFALSSPAEFDLVTQAHRDLMKVWHPDRFERDPRLRQRAEEEFKHIQQAFAYLREHAAAPATQEAWVPIQEPAPPAPAQGDPPPYAQSTPAQDLPVFFAVSGAKLVLLSLCTFGIYELYWFYKNWEAIKARTGLDIMPFWRAFFTIFFCRSCFRYIRDVGEVHGLKQPPNVTLWATLWILATISWRLPDPYWLVTLSSVFFLLPIQNYVNKIVAVEAPGRPRVGFTLWNWLVLVPGGLFLFLVFLGVFLPPQK